MTLTERDIQLLEHIVTGATAAEMARKTKYTPGTMRVYLHYLYKKIKVRNKTEAAVWWLKEKTNVVSPPDSGAVRVGHVVQPAKPRRNHVPLRRT